MNGTILPETIKELSFEKEVTLFVDGDRGGTLIARNAIENARIDYVVVAPDGKEVEELSPKEILSALRKRVKVDEFLGKIGNNNGKREYSRRGRERTIGRARERTEERKTVDKRDIEKLTDEQIDKIREQARDILGTKEAILLNEELEKIRTATTSQLYNLRNRNVFALVIDGTATANIVKSAEKIGCQHLVARNFAYTETDMELVSL